MDIKTVYEKLIAPLPKEAIERAPKEISRKGYDTTGYQYAFLVERLNEVLGINGWSWKYQIIKEIEGVWQGSTGREKKYYDITVECTIIIVIDGVSISRVCVGGHRAEIYSDALKGAITNAFKKTVSLFGLGNDAYKGVIDEDYRPIPEESERKTKKSKSITSEEMKRIQDGGITNGQLKYLKILQNDRGMEKDEMHNFCQNIIGREIKSAKELTMEEASKIIKVLENMPKTEERKNGSAEEQKQGGDN